MAWQLVTVIRDFTDFALEFLDNLCKDWEQIRLTFSPNSDLGYVVSVVSAGDTHRRGRAVLVLQFSTDFKLVYKPKSLQVDAHFQQLLEWVSKFSPDLQFQTIKVLDQGAYGWVEFVEQRGCKTVAELERFYQRMDGYLAMTGIAGIGYELLRLAEPDIVPSVLLLETPCISTIAQ